MKAILAVLIISVIMISGCVQQPPASQEPPADSSTPPAELPSPIQIQYDRSLTPQECSERGLEGRIILIYSPTCPACGMTKPLLIEAASEAGKTVEEINLVTDRGKLDEIGILPYYIPTTIIDCEVLVGAKQKFEFRDMMERM